MSTQIMHSVRQMSPQEQALVMAIAVLTDQLRRLSVQAKADLLELVKELAVAPNDDERCAIVDTMLEIFECRSAKIEPMSFSPIDQETPNSAKAWMEFVATRVREARTAAGVTQEELSAKTGLPQPHISRIENAKLSPSRATIQKIAQALGKEVADFDFNAPRSDPD